MINQRKLLPAGRMLVIAALAGALAGAVAVYVTGRLPGNNAPSAPAAQIDAADQSDCVGKTERARQVAAAATGQVAAMLPADPPQSLSGLAFNAPDGTPMTLADRAGRTVLLNLWATWCAPCRAEMPALDALQKEAGNDRFEVMAINVDTGNDVKPRKFLAETKIQSLGYYRDPTLGLFNELKARGLALGLPVTLLVDGEGCLLAHMNGPAEWASPDARTLVTKALTR